MGNWVIQLPDKTYVAWHNPRPFGLSTTTLLVCAKRYNRKTARRLIKHYNGATLIHVQEKTPDTGFSLISPTTNDLVSEQTPQGAPAAQKTPAPHCSNEA